MEPRGHSYQRGERIGSHLMHDLPAVRFYRDLTDAEFAADLFVQQTRNDQRHNLALAGSKRGVTVLKFLHFRIPGESETAALEGLPNGV